MDGLDGQTARSDPSSASQPWAMCDDRPWNRDSARNGSFVCAVIHKVKSRLKVTFLFSRPFIHFAKYIHKSSGWVNFNRQLPSFITFDIQILFFCSWNWFVSKSEITYWTQVRGIKLMAGCDSEPADGLVAPRRCPNMEPIQCKQKKQRNSTQKHLLFKLSISPTVLVLWVSLTSTLRDKICARDWEAIRL